ncbi:hypothetical protein K2173_022464 [Erythroxylum novogranatense]|uniref:30S ribosomal protein S6 n=1 Tax=Erythroxylum novogranatense TaxID=1862640 RepID=A0AAV8THV2_9ROSI|nr:hypothetical protein K2173_022464 [Erythroxylum novogranatense]
MKILLHSSATYPLSTHPIDNGFNVSRSSSCNFPGGFPSSLSFSCRKLSFRLRKQVFVCAKKNKNKTTLTTSYPNKMRPLAFSLKRCCLKRLTLPFPVFCSSLSALACRPKKVQEDGSLLPDFADAEEQKLYEALNLEMESQLKVGQMRHYEVVYLIHEKHAEEVSSVNEKVQDFLREKKGKVWRFSDWGMRRLAYKIQKAKNAHYILMNFELEAKSINEFKSMLDKDERVIRHLVIKRDKAITEDCPPPPEYHTLRGGADDYDDDDDFDYDEDDEVYDDWDGEEEEGVYDEQLEDGVIFVGSDEYEDSSEDKNNRFARVRNT